MNRVSLAIKSNLPNEMDWALRSLVRMSFESPDSLALRAYPGLAPVLLEKISQLRFLESLSKGGAEDDMHESRGQKEVFDKMLEAALVLRNTSINVENAQYLASLPHCASVLIAALQLPDLPQFVEFKQYCLDIVESISIFSHPRSAEDPLFTILSSYLRSDDRAVLISSLRSLARLVINIEKNLLSTVDLKTITRISMLLLLDDEELLSACLDFLYQYTVHKDNVDRLSHGLGGLNDIVKTLRRLLLFQAQDIIENGNGYGRDFVEPDSPQFMPRKIPPPLAPPRLPAELIQELLELSEPERATQWLKVCFEEDPDGDVTQIALWKSYESLFEEYAKQGKKLLPAADFIKNVTNAFKRAAAMVITTSAGQKFIIKGIRPREKPASLLGQYYVDCQWTINDKKCQLQFPSVQHLYRHILVKHLRQAVIEGDEESNPISGISLKTSSVPTKDDIISTDDGDTDIPAESKSEPEEVDEDLDKDENGNYIMFCRWNDCNRFAESGETDRWKVTSHIRTHIPEVSENMPVPLYVRESADFQKQEFRKIQHISHSGVFVGHGNATAIGSRQKKVLILSKTTTTDERGEAAGIALTAVLILRNIARCKSGKRVLRGVGVSDVIGVAAINRALRNYAVDLLDLIESGSDSEDGVE
ncbi:uncharacterized protein V1510DRAFT_420318 [Dipodascopsis tothii]|uniref:uncharacterized protein n=1 Tax=Dipodascopsis tothii TaxID=44089 RepID=UPI0034CFBCAD